MTLAQQLTQALTEGKKMEEGNCSSCGKPMHEGLNCKGDKLNEGDMCKTCEKPMNECGCEE